MTPDKVVIGTAKFGIPYGLSKCQSTMPLTIGANILADAEAKGIRYLDTAPSYGESECLAREYKSFQVTTKLLKVDCREFCKRTMIKLEQCFDQSLNRMGRDSVYGLFVHQPEDLLKKGAELLLNWMRQKKSQGVVSKIGVSVYCPRDVLQLYELSGFDIIQLPLNIMNRSFDLGLVGALSKQGVEIHARSLFMKGALLKRGLINTVVPKDLQRHHTSFMNYLSDRGCAPIDACKLFVNEQKLIDKWVIGANSITQLGEVLAPVRYKGVSLDFDRWAIADQELLDIRGWK